MLILLIAWPVWGAYCIVPPALDQNCASSKCASVCLVMKSYLRVVARQLFSTWSSSTSTGARLASRPLSLNERPLG